MRNPAPGSSIFGKTPTIKNNESTSSLSRKFETRPKFTNRIPSKRGLKNTTKEFITNDFKKETWS